VFVDLVDSALYLGFLRGYYARLGLDMRMQQYPTAEAMIEPLKAGQLEVVCDAAPSAALFNALTDGSPLKLVGNQGASDASHDLPYYALVVSRSLADSGQVKRVSDLMGRPVNIVARGSLAHFSVDQALRSDGLSLADVQLREVAPQASIAELRDGTLAASFLAEPLITPARLQGNVDILVNLEKLAPGRDFATVLYSQAFAQRQVVANNFMIAYLQGVRDYLRLIGNRAQSTERAAVIDQLLGFLSVKDPRVFDQLGLPAINPDGRLNAADLQIQLDWFVAQGLVRSPHDVAQFVDNQFVESALSQIGPYTP
jgi:NitT/TauT family transport system substrate-binding protein